MNFKKIFYLIVLLNIFFVSNVFAQQLSEKAEISVLTCEPGDELYSTFGHSAIRIKDSELNIDWVYNYGTFNFNTPNFYWKFASGRLDYMLSLADFNDFMQEYYYYNRTVREQIFNLNKEEKQYISDFLQKNYKPENRYYRYEFFFDNCATRIRDVFIKLFLNKIKFGEILSTSKPVTFRDLIDIYLKKLTWENFGINLILGLPTDRKASSMQSMFLPDYLEKGFASATINRDTAVINLVKESRVVFQAKPVVLKNSFITPQSVLWSLFGVLLLITFIEYKKKKLFRGIDFFIFLIAGLLSLLIIFLWFFTEHVSTVNNFNILFALPSHLYFAFLMLRKNKPEFFRKYFLLFGCLCILMLGFMWFLPQRLDISVIPVLLILSLRSINIYRFFK